MSKYLGIKACLCYFVRVVTSWFSDNRVFLKTGLDHLPLFKQEKLHLVTSILLQKIKPEMIILFGSFTMDSCPGHRYGLGLLVITENDIPESSSRWDKVEKLVEKCSRINPVCLFLHTIYFVNDEISAGNYFFGDMLNHGIVLHNTGRFHLAQPVDLSPDENKIKAQGYFIEWFHSACQFFDSFQSNFEKGSHKLAVFELHQAVERFYTCTLLVHTGYRPKTHNIYKLGLMCAFFNKDLYLLFPRSNSAERGLFDLLRSAYIDARYKTDYSIAAEQLRILSFSVHQLKALTEKVCSEKIAGFAINS